MIEGTECTVLYTGNYCKSNQLKDSLNARKTDALESIDLSLLNQRAPKLPRKQENKCNN